MDSIDVLGERPDRHAAFTRELLAETDDTELQRIVETAARQLSSPIALVTLVLDQIQFFKAHYGLPADLAAARGTRRDVSFCQFVVRDDQAFEVPDARSDPRVPTHLVDEYGIRAYLGVPIRVGDIVIGSLCVLDTEARRFSDQDRQSLAELASLVDARVKILTEGRRQARLSLTQKVAAPALADLRQTLGPVRTIAGSGLGALAAVRSFLRLSSFVLAGGATPPEVMRRSLEGATLAADAVEDGLHDIMMAASDCEDCALALEHLTMPAAATRLSEALAAAKELTLLVTRPVGGAPLPDLPPDPGDLGCDPVVYTPRPLAVALLATALATLSSRLAAQGATGGIRVRLRDLGATAEVGLSAEGLPDGAIAEVTAELCEHIGKDPSVAVSGSGGEVCLVFSVVEAE